MNQKKRKGLRLCNEVPFPSQRSEPHTSCAHQEQFSQTLGDGDRPGHHIGLGQQPRLLPGAALPAAGAPAQASGLS